VVHAFNNSFIFLIVQIIGLHGAALIHGVFARRGLVMVEFKMQYAYTSLLFPLVTDSRVGKHAVLDTREYFFVRGQKLPPGTRVPDGAIDSKLINRTLALMSYTFDLDSTSKDIYLNNPSLFRNDFIFGSMVIHNPSSPPSRDVLDLAHVLGPVKTLDIEQKCKNMLLSRARKKVFLSQRLKRNKTMRGSESSDGIHCPVCYED
jgi:hypothetical protein